MRQRVAIREFVAFLLLVSVVTGCAAARWSKKTFCGEPIEEGRKGNLSYALYAAASPAEEKGACFVLLHPAGSSGSDYIRKWVPLLGHGQNVIVAPDATSEMPYGSEAFQSGALELIEDVRDSENINSRNIFLIGESNGAIYGYQLIAEHPEMFHAAALISGALNEKVEVKWRERRGEVKTRLLIVHGAQDAMFKVKRARKEAELLRVLAAQVEYREIPDMGHGADPFVEEDVAAWFSAVEKEKAAN